MNAQQAVEILNESLPGWVNLGANLICNPHDDGGIIDTNIVSGKWFAVTNHGTYNDIELSHAVELFTS